MFNYQNVPYVWPYFVGTSHEHPWTIGLIHGRYLQWIGSWNGHASKATWPRWFQVRSPWKRTTQFRLRFVCCLQSVVGMVKACYSANTTPMCPNLWYTAWIPVGEHKYHETNQTNTRLSASSTWSYMVIIPVLSGKHLHVYGKQHIFYRGNSLFNGLLQ